MRLADTGPDGRLRVDGLARFLQDVATEDSEDAGLDAGATWVARRTSFQLAAGARWPVLGETFELTTWCGGTGAAWAERRTDLTVDGTLQLESAVLWVPLDAAGRPTRISPEFRERFGESCAGRRVSGRVARTSPPAGATTRPWPLRRSDLDVIGHVNNAAVWEAIVELLDASATSASVIHHGPLDAGDAVELASVDGRLWLLVDGDVRVAAEFTTGPTDRSG